MSSRYGNDLFRDLIRHLGETVTIFTTSGGESGRGFTGVLIGVGCREVRLLAQIGPAPGCALGSCCDNRRGRHIGEDNDELDNQDTNRIDCNLRRTGAIVVIPINRIAAFVHNTLR